MAEDTFKLPGSSYAELVKIIRAYGHAPEEAVPKDVADRGGMDPTIVSRNNAFLISIGILSGGKKKSLTSPGRALSQALDFEMPDQIADAWRAIAAENEFLRKIVSAVRIRGGMEPSSLRNHVAYTAGVPRKASALTGAGSVIDVLKAAGLLREADGRIVAVDEAEATAQPSGRLEKASTSGEPSVRRTVTVPLPQAGVVPSLQIQVRIDCKPEDMASLGPKLRSMLKALSQVSPDPESEEA